MRAPTRSSLLSLLVAAAICGTATDAHAQWGADTATNTSLGDGASDQTQAKVVARADGGTYVSWFDGIGSGFDVKLQRLTAGGNEVFAHNGVLVADRSFSSTQDYGLDVDASGNALLVFRDDRPAGIQITAAKISPTGTALWTATGIQLTSTTDFLAAPKIAGTDDGGAIVAWTQNSDTRVQKLDASGAPLWGAGVTLTPGVGSYSASDLHDDGSGAILAFVHQSGGFGSPRHLLAQKFDGSGGLLWGAGHVAVFDGGSLQFGNFPTFVPDGSGGAVFSWYDTAGVQLQCYAQHVLTNGSEAFGHNGSAVSTNPRDRVSPSASFDPFTGNTTVCWVEQTLTTRGLYAQEFNAGGVRQWGTEGAVVVALDTPEIGLVRNVATADRTFVFWASATGFGTDVLRGARLDGGGAIDIGPFDVASTASSKSRLAVARTTKGHAVLAWKDERNDSGDVLGQNVNCDGTLGPADVDAPWTDLGGALAGQAGVPVLAATGTLCPGDDVTFSLTNARASTTAALVIGVTNLSIPFKGGTLVPSADVIFFGLPVSAGGTLIVGGAWLEDSIAGLTLYWQYWITDAVGPFGFSASNGLSSTVP